MIAPTPSEGSAATPDNADYPASRPEAPGYLDRILDILDAAPPRGVFLVTVQHDPDCPFLEGGPCRCVPDIIREALDGEGGNA